MNDNHLAAKKWFDEMIIELRLRNVRGDAIGDAVAAVETHCAESSKNPADAFGDPREYARDLHFRPSQLTDNRPSDWARTVGPVAIGLIGVSLVPGLTRALFDHTPVTVSWGDLTGLALFATIVAISMFFLRALLQNKLTGILFFGGAVAMVAMLPALLPGTAFALPVMIVSALALACLAASVLGMWRQRHTLDDPIIDPRTGQRTIALPSIVTIWLFPIIAVAIGVITAIPAWFSR